VINVNLSGLFYSMKYEVPPILAAGGGPSTDPTVTDGPA